MFAQSTAGDAYRQVALKISRSPHLREVKTWYTNASEKGPPASDVAAAQCPRVDMIPTYGSPAWRTEGMAANACQFEVVLRWVGHDAAVGLDFMHAVIKAIKEPLPELCQANVGEAKILSWTIRPDDVGGANGFVANVQVSFLNQILTGQPG